MYVVVFTTLVLSVLTASFIRIMISEKQQTTNYDLSQSAYDSALAGVEDAKTAVLKYHKCLSDGFTKNSSAIPGTCGYIIYAMEDGIKNKSCDVVADVLHRTKESSGEVTIQETNTTATNSNASFMDQAYTCVTIEEELNDYRAYLDSNNRLRLVPLRSDNTSNIKGIQFQWYSEANASSRTTATKYMSNGKLQPNDVGNPYAPPVITFDIFQTDSESFYNQKPNFTLGELSANNGTGSNGTDHARLVLYPALSGSDLTNKINASLVLNQSDKNNNSPIKIKCDNAPNAAGFYCSTYIELPMTYRLSNTRSPDSFFAMVTLPYGAPATDFSISLCTDSDGSLCSATANSGANSTDGITTFSAVQAKIDSTGRANDLYRRVETRVETVDTGFPYPQYVLDVADDISKEMWVTKNCISVENGDGHTCSDNGVN